MPDRTPTPAELVADLERIFRAVQIQTRDRGEPVYFNGAWTFQVGMLIAKLKRLPQPHTVAISTCSWCGAFCGAKDWSGPNAIPGELHTLTHTICDDCSEDPDGDAREADTDPPEARGDV